MEAISWMINQQNVSLQFFHSYHPIDAVRMWFILVSV